MKSRRFRNGAQRPQNARAAIRLIHWDGAKAKRFQRCYHNKLAMKALFDVVVPGERDYGFASGIESDILVRTSGAMRIRNFLLWQIAHSELLRATLDYQQRDRCFGGLGEAAPLNSDDTDFEIHLNFR
jgi:hypothetical protein